MDAVYGFPETFAQMGFCVCEPFFCGVCVVVVRVLVCRFSLRFCGGYKKQHIAVVLLLLLLLLLPTTTTTTTTTTTELPRASAAATLEDVTWHGAIHAQAKGL